MRRIWIVLGILVVVPAIGLGAAWLTAGGSGVSDAEAAELYGGGSAAGDGNVAADAACLNFKAGRCRGDHQNCEITGCLVHGGSDLRGNSAVTDPCGALACGVVFGDVTGCDGSGGSAQPAEPRHTEPGGSSGNDGPGNAVSPATGFGES